jgi:hypothetical protein
VKTDITPYDVAVFEVARLIHAQEFTGCGSLDRPGQRPAEPHRVDIEDAEVILDEIKATESARRAVARFLRGPQ